MALLFRPLIPVDYSHWIPALQQAAAAHGHDLRIAPDIGDPEDIEYLIAWRLEEGDRTAWPNLKAILSLSTGVNQYIGHPEMPDGARLVRMIDPGLTRSMAEYVTSFVLRFHREHDRITGAGTDVHWGGIMPKLAHQRRVGIMGMGILGQACAAALRPFGFGLQGWSQSPKVIEGVDHFAGSVHLPDFLRTSEILVNLLPLTAATENILNRDTLSQLPRGACLINVARGKHLVEEDLLSLMDEGQIAYAALDVFRREPLAANHPFRKQPRILVTPHIAAITMPDTAIPVLLDVIRMMEAGENPAGLVDPERGY